VFKPSLFAAIGAAIALSGAIVQPVRAQEGGAYSGGAAAQTPTQEEVETGRQSNAQADGGRTGRIRRENRNSQAAAAATPEQNVAAAQVIATAAGSPCQVTLANPLGVTAEQHVAYEATCATGPGYILIASTPPQAVDCVLLAGQAEIERSRNPAADAGTQCVIPQNTDVVRVVAAYAAEAGVSCTVDQGASIGKSTAGNLIYEVGCNGTDGFWLEKEPTGWKKTECSTILTQNATCRFSSVAEQAATLKARFASNPEAAACDVIASRYMGANVNGSFFEAKCAAGNGIITRFDNAYVVQQVYPCETAQRIGGGCTLTVVAAPPAAEAPAATPPAQ